MLFRILVFITFIMAGYSSDTKRSKVAATAFEKSPKWAREAIWYQIFVERFRNGNPNINPTLKTCENGLIDALPPDWEISPWGQNWYEQEAWAKKTGLDFYRTIQMRRYGGDLAGVEEKIPYLKDLGINAIYFNPLNDTPSLHKYDARSYHHIDVTFGDDIAGDQKLMARENPGDPSTWQWTSADKKFINLVKKLHSEGIRVVLDFSWNHTGNNFWAFKDIEKNLDKSPYKDWYHTSFTKDEDTGKTTLNYEGWIGIKTLPELKKIDHNGKIPGHPYEGNMLPAVKEHIFAVSRRWMDPNGDGRFEDGIDGMRLDVAEHVPMGFWRDFRRYVRTVNPDFYLVGENWWSKWPDELMDPTPWVKGDVFDAVMHYQWFKEARSYFAEPNDKLTLNQFKDRMVAVFLKYPDYTQQAMMNLASSHDSPSLLSSFYNVNKYKFNCKPQEDKNYRTNYPPAITHHRVRLFLMHQFTFVGSPHIWNGDEMGMTGADDPDTRKPLVWPDIPFDDETQSEYSEYKYSEKPKFDSEIYEYYKSMIQLRKSSEAFIYGNFEFENFDDDKNILGYRRTFNDESFLILFNNNDQQNTLQVPLDISGYRIVFSYQADADQNGKILTLPPYSGLVLRIMKFSGN